jgi:anti-sigma B factor antagonist
MSTGDLLISEIRGVCVVTFRTASILDAATVGTIAKQLYQLVDQEARRKLVLDFSEVRFLTSQMLGVLISLHKKSQAIDGKVVLCGIRTELGKVFKITRLDKMLSFAENEEAALETFGVSGRA